MSVFKRKTGKGETQEYHYKFMQSRKWYFGVCEGCTTERTALDYEKKLRATVKKAAGQKTVKALVDNFIDDLSGGKTVKLAEAYEHYLTKPRRRAAGKKQEAVNRTYMRDFIAFMSEKYPSVENLRDVTSNHAEKYIHYLKNYGPFVKNITVKRRDRNANIQEFEYKTRATELSPRTINARHKLLKSIFEWLKVDAGMINNPFSFATIKNKSESRDVFSDEELKRIGENFSMPYTKPVFIIGLCTGLSLGDICLLKWSEIKDGWITGKKRRKTGTPLDIPILPPLQKFLCEQQAIKEKQEYVAPELAEMYLTNPSGINLRIKNFLESINIQTSMKPGQRSRKISVKSAHAMRHTFAYLAGLHEVPLVIVQSILGHLTPRMSQLYQAHATRKEKQKLLSKMPDALGISSPSSNMLPAIVEPERTKLIQLINALPLTRVKELLVIAESKN